MGIPVQFDDNVACERCGRFGAFAFDGQKLCIDCYQASGACCAESAASAALAVRDQPRCEGRAGDP